MSSLYLQYNNLPQWLLSWFYYLQFKVAHLFHVTDQQAFGITLMTVLSSFYLLVILLIALRVFLKTRDRRYHTIHGDSIVLLGPYGSGKTSLFYAISVFGNENHDKESEDTVPQMSTDKVNVASITNAGVGRFTQGDRKSVV